MYNIIYIIINDIYYIYIYNTLLRFTYDMHKPDCFRLILSK